jgi:hypothetical protein
MTTPDVSTLKVAKDDLIFITMDLDDEQAQDDLIAALHKRFPANMILMLSPGETIEARPEEEVKALLKAILDHQEYREHKELAGG